ncbi:glycosyltransferase [Microbacterium soli]|uniref:glycosyltransferase n=1 Tax=Microbacterium soli TaxID=446075 RepID=UPI0031E082F9
MPHKPVILCISLSPIRRDARVLRQIGLLREYGDVVTVGFGPRPDGVSEHLEVPADLATLPQTVPGVIGLALRRFRSVELAAPAVAWARDALRGRRFDLVVANEARVLALASRVAGDAPVWADMHEWAPEERTHILSWRLLVAPFMTYLCRRYLPGSALVTTVGDSIATLYRKTFGVKARLMRNAGPYRPLEASRTEEGRIRLVHSGAAIHGRKLELMIEAMALLDERFTLDLYLVPGGDDGAYLAELRRLAAHDSRITFHAPVAPEALPSTLNAYDVGVFWIPPAHTNARLTLPNKFFDYVQARLLVAVGPSPEMEPLIAEHGLGVVSTGFSVKECARSLAALTTDQIVRAKAASDAAAAVLNFEHEKERMRPQLGALIEGSSPTPNGATR